MAQYLALFIHFSMATVLAIVLPYWRAIRAAFVLNAVQSFASLPLEG